MLKLLPMVCAFTLGWGGSALAQPPVIFTWNGVLEMTEEECVRRSQLTLRQQGLQNVRIQDIHIDGETNRVSVSIACFGGSKSTLIFIVVAAPTPEEARLMRDGLSRNF
ncbi:hypothetical protein GlitD10_0353 [Gloeomargarita lithophora Alchichica-D10]|uniref:Uncharacterized protein n=1 Tax=Gloeomargarita lithophora Alchichica-D10 TaxID=1188229 RepID=A0A1J0A9R5_9CYAN|nr:hypothetical protein [Gloeomargarita lithophora]APB32663.1 hypothetical protein GlitD10_0353 [Gloeomargarita lithophora Alchichica-D10]